MCMYVRIHDVYVRVNMMHVCVYMCYYGISRIPDLLWWGGGVCKKMPITNYFYAALPPLLGVHYLELLTLSPWICHYSCVCVCVYVCMYMRVRV